MRLKHKVGHLYDAAVLTQESIENLIEAVRNLLSTQHIQANRISGLEARVLELESKSTVVNVYKGGEIID